MAKTTTSTPQEKSGDSGRKARPIEPRRAGGGDSAVRRPNAPSPVSFFRESQAELRKVTWPTRQEAMNLTIAVIVLTVAIAAFLGLIDTGLDTLVSHLIG